MMNIDKQPNLNFLWSAIAVEECIRHNITQFFISPGSRSAPLTMAVAENDKANAIVHFDERGAAFAALGYASSGKIPVLITTSGTAVANLLPAIIEISKKKLPVIVLTADRPPELRQTGAHQTIDQVNIFGQYVRWFFDFPCPTEDIHPSLILTTIDQAISMSQGELRGPVHINFMFREPLSPKKESIPKKYTSSIAHWINNQKPYSQYLLPQRTLSKDSVDQNISAINSIKDGVIVVGKLKSESQIKSVLSLAEKLNWPIFPDVSSGLRTAQHHAHVIHYFDQILSSDKLTNNLKIDGVIHLGGRMTSKRYYQWMEKQNIKEYITVLNHPLRNDPLNKVTLRIQSSIEYYCKQTSSLLSKRKTSSSLNYLQKTNDHINQTIEKFLNSSKTVSELSISRQLSRLLPKNSVLFLASSLPIRQFSLAADPAANSISIASNRGASGIDGTIASAIGMNIGSEKPTVLLIGDLALLHDCNSLALIKNIQKPFVIICFNNGGGGIFNYLPIAHQNKHFNQYFAAEHSFTFKSLAQQFECDYISISSADAFNEQFQSAIKKNNTTLIEIPTNREENVNINKKLYQMIDKIV